MYTARKLSLIINDGGGGNAGIINKSQVTGILRVQTRQREREIAREIERRSV